MVPLAVHRLRVSFRDDWPPIPKIMTGKQDTRPGERRSQNGWALHGRVYEVVANQPSPVSGSTVFLADASGAYQQSYGFAFTDDTGYFLLNYPGPDAASRHTSAAATQAADVSELFIKVADREAKRECLIDTSFQPPIGAATYQNIYLSTAQQSTGQPPPEIRQVAMPKPKKSG